MSFEENTKPEKQEKKLYKIIDYQDGSRYDFSKNMQCDVSNLTDEQIMDMRNKRSKNKYFRKRYVQNLDYERNRSKEKFQRLFKKKEEDKKEPGRKRKY